MANIIAEIGSVHDGSFGNACKLVEAAAKCGATTIKFQTHIAEAETLHDAPSPGYFSAENRFDYFKRTAFDFAQYKDLIALCDSLGVEFLSSPFSLEAVDFLQEAGVHRLKIPSGEITNLPLLKHAAGTDKPVLLSSGMSDWKELDAAVQAASKASELTIMQCTSMYPCPPQRVGLNIIQEMADRYQIPVGFSDHSNGYAAAFAAVAQGASFVEKHFTFSRLMYGSDAANAMEPTEFSVYCQGIKDISTMLSNPVDKDDLSPYADMKRVFEKSMVTARDLSSGKSLTMEDIAFKKPGDGISAAQYEQFLGRKLLRNIACDTKLTEQDFEPRT